MSKIALRRELALMSEDQLRQIIMDAYSARKEIKEYFDYFLNPDPVAKGQEYIRKMAREMARRRGPRATVLKKLLKDFAQFRPGMNIMLDLYAEFWALFIINYDTVYISQAIENLLDTTCRDAVAMADADGALTAIDRIYDNIDSMFSRSRGKNVVMRSLRDARENI